MFFRHSSSRLRFSSFAGVMIGRRFSRISGESKVIFQTIFVLSPWSSKSALRKKCGATICSSRIWSSVTSCHLLWFGYLVPSGLTIVKIQSPSGTILQTSNSFENPAGPHHVARISGVFHAWETLDRGKGRIRGVVQVEFIELIL